MNEASLRRIQIREAIKAHFDKEQALFAQGIKVLSLFFIDEVAKYRDYDDADEHPASTPGCSRRSTSAQLERSARRWSDTAYNRYLKGIASRQDPQRLLLHRQEDQAAGRPGREDARRDPRAKPTTSTPTT